MYSQLIESMVFVNACSPLSSPLMEITIFCDNGQCQSSTTLTEEEVITGVCAKTLFLSAYSPDLVPSEVVFAKVKSILKSNDKVYTLSI